MRPVVIVIVLPFFQLRVEEVNVVRNPVTVEELVELLIIDPMGSFDLAVQMWRPRPDVHMADVAFFEMPVKVGLEFSAIVRLDHMDAERQAAEDVVDELDGRALITGIVDLEHANPGAIVDRRELVEAPAGARNPLEKLDVDLQPMSRLGFLVARPAMRMPPVLLIGWQPVHAVAAQNSMDGRTRD